MHRTLGATLAIALTAAIAGCGGGGSGQPVQQVRSSSALASRADAICRPAEGDGLVKKLHSILRHEHLARQQMHARALAVLSSTGHKALDELSALKAPAALEARYESYVAARRRGFALMLEAQSRSAPSTTREAHGEESTELSEKRAQLARELGFRTCR